MEINFLRLIHLEIFFKEFQSDGVQRNREAVPSDLQSKVKTSLTSEDGQNYGTIPMPMFASRPLTTSCTTSGGLPAELLWSDSKDSKYRNYNSTGSLIPHHSWCGKQDSKHRSQVVLILRRKPMLWITEVEMVDSLDELNIFTVSFWKRFCKF